MLYYIILPDPLLPLWQPEVWPDMGSSRNAKKMRKQTETYLVKLLSHMRFVDRLTFAFTGSFLTALIRAERAKRKARRLEWEQVLFWIDVISIALVLWWL